MESGYSVSRAIERVQAEDEHNVPSRDKPQITKWESYRQRLVDAVDHFDTAALESAYNEPLTLFPIDLIIDEVLLPVLQRLGEEWQQREDGIAREHFFSAFLRNKIGTRFNHEMQRSQGASLLLACLPGEAHEMGLMLFGLAAAARGFRVLYLGADLPLSQLEPVVAQVGPAAIALSGTTRELDTTLERELRELVHSIQIPVYIGGDIAESEASRLSALGLIPVGREFRDGVERIIHATRARRAAGG
jgi:methanogenic corrinoid protein MtbC1